MRDACFLFSLAPEGLCLKCVVGNQGGGGGGGRGGVGVFPESNRDPKFLSMLPETPITPEGERERERETEMEGEEYRQSRPK